MSGLLISFLNQVFHSSSSPPTSTPPTSSTEKSLPHALRVEEKSKDPHISHTPAPRLDAGGLASHRYPPRTGGLHPTGQSTPTSYTTFLHTHHTRTSIRKRWGMMKTFSTFAVSTRAVATNLFRRQMRAIIFLGCLTPHTHQSSSHLHCSVLLRTTLLTGDDTDHFLPTCTQHSCPCWRSSGRSWSRSLERDVFQ